MQKRDPVIIAPDSTDDELYEWMHQKIKAVQDLKWANEARAKQAENLSALEQDITNLEKSDVNKRVISVCVNGHVLSSIKTETATVFDCLCIVQSLVDALFRSVNLENDANLRGRIIAHPYAHTLGSVDIKDPTNL